MRCGWWLIAGEVSAGFPSAAEGYEDEPLNLHTWLVRHPAATFFFRVRGDALRDEGVRDGAILVVDRAVTPRPNGLALVEEDGGFVVRRVGKVESVVVCGAVVAVVMRLL